MRRDRAGACVVFDLGGVLLDWDPRHLYRKLFPGDEAAMEAFLADVCTPEWNVRQDAGRPFAEADRRALCRSTATSCISSRRGAERFDEMIPGAIEDTVAVAARAQGARRAALRAHQLVARDVSAQRARFAFLDWFDGIVVSGSEGVIKPDPRIFRILLDRYGIAANEAVFIDDNPKNAQAASAARHPRHPLPVARAVAARACSRFIS